MNCLLFCSPQANQRALAHKVAKVMPLAGIVTVRPRRSWSKKAPTFAQRLRGIGAGLANRTIGLPLRRAWFEMLANYERQYPAFPPAPLIEVDDINDASVFDLVNRGRPDLVLVSGTNLLGQPLISAIAEFGKVLNLHTGISPYVRGGPNCTNWCLAIRRPDLIGNTVMWLDAGIDSGNLVATERTPIDGRESLLELQIKVMEHAHDLYCRCVERFGAGSVLPNVPQRALGAGQLFLTRDWDAGAVARAVINFYIHYRPDVRQPPEPLRLVDLEDR